MKNNYFDHADYLEEVYQDSLDTDTCPACGGVGRIPDEECLTDCECELCLGEGIVNETVRRNYLKDKKMIMTDLKNLSRNLRIDEIDFRVGSVMGQQKTWATILAYKDSRVDMNVLDEVVGCENWQIKFREEKGCVVASVGIKINDEWVWKEGNGTAGDFEAEKSSYADGQKRAGFQWGIGRSLYNFPKIFVELLEGEHSNGKATNKLRPSDWKWTVEYEGDKVKKMSAKDKTGKLRFNYDANV